MCGPAITDQLVSSLLVSTVPDQLGGNQDTRNMRSLHLNGLIYMLNMLSHKIDQKEGFECSEYLTGI